MLYYTYTYKEGTALSNETKLAKKEAKAAKKEAKAEKKAVKTEKKQAAAYAKLVKKIDKKNVKLEKKANKKGKPFVPIAVPTQEEAFAADNGHKVRRIILMIILILLIWYLIYFMVMWFSYVAPIPEAEPDEPSVVQEYERYSNPHEITTTPDYSVSEAKTLLKQVLHDNWKRLNYSSDPSGGSINYTSNVINVNNADCYVFTAGSRTYAVSVKLQSVYVEKDGKYIPVTFERTNYLFNE